MLIDERSAKGNSHGRIRQQTDYAPMHLPHRIEVMLTDIQKDFNGPVFTWRLNFEANKLPDWRPTQQITHCGTSNSGIVAETVKVFGNMLRYEMLDAFRYKWP
jgi:hypothetical protein